MDEPQKPLAIFYAYDTSEIETYSHSIGYSCIIFDMKQYIRSKLKYGNDYSSVDAALEDIQSTLYGLCENYHIPED